MYLYVFYCLNYNFNQQRDQTYEENKLDLDIFVSKTAFGSLLARKACLTRRSCVG